MLKYFFFLFFPLLNLISCNAQIPVQNSNLVLLKKRLFDLKTGESIFPRYERDRKYWYYDSCAIIENLHLYINEDPIGKETWEMLIDNYTFVDFRTKSFFIISSFSDTANIQEKFTQPDTGRVKGGWHFFTKESLFSNNVYEFLSDTTINQIVYKRIKGFMYNKALKAPTKDLIIGYMRCDIKNLPFSMDPVMSRITGCSLIRIDIIGENATKGISSEYEYISSSLTAKDLATFKVIRKKIRKYNLN